MKVEVTVVVHWVVELGSHEFHPSVVEDVAGAVLLLLLVELAQSLHGSVLDLLEAEGVLLVDEDEDHTPHGSVLELVLSEDLLLVVELHSLQVPGSVLVLVVASGVLEVDHSDQVAGSLELVGFTEELVLDSVHAVQVEESASGVLVVASGVFVVAGSLEEDQPSHESD